MRQPPPDPPQALVLRDDTWPPNIAPATRLADLRYATEADLADALPGAEILFLWDFRSAALARAWASVDTLRWVHIASAGVDKLLFPELITSDVVVTNSRGVFEEPIAEYVLGLVLCFAKDLHTTISLQRQRQWRHRETERLTGAGALVVGTGPIGAAIGRRLTGAGLRVSGIGRTSRSGDPDLGDIRSFERLPEALAEADYVVLAAPLTDVTREMINATTLAAMKPSARLVNVGRGQLVNQPDLIAALSANRIAGAALDVFTDEPLEPSSPLWELPNVLISPHMSGDVIGWRQELVDLFVDNLTRYRQGDPLRNIVDKRLGYVPSGPLAESKGAP
ncbi:MAG TPA: D-2-hydroxyacid dehydrogenase [Pseudonocardiaceae bacterium]|nr:D-2-hydroxyacid dehydrogenase [Pseudonocardiaceae bacterium]